MASETALHSNTVSSSRTQADQLVSPQARRALGHFVHAQPYRERGLPVSLWQACNRTCSVIRWPAHCLLALCPYCLTLSLSLFPFLSSVALISSLLHLCLRLCTAQYPPHHPLPLSTAEEAKQHGPTHPLAYRYPVTHPPIFSPDPFKTISLNQHADSVRWVTYPPSWSHGLSAWLKGGSATSVLLYHIV